MPAQASARAVGTPGRVERAAVPGHAPHAAPVGPDREDAEAAAPRVDVGDPAPVGRPARQPALVRVERDAPQRVHAGPVRVHDREPRPVGLAAQERQARAVRRPRRRGEVLVDRAGERPQPRAVGADDEEPRSPGGIPRGERQPRPVGRPREAGAVVARDARHRHEPVALGEQHLQRLARRPGRRRTRSGSRRATTPVRTPPPARRSPARRRRQPRRRAPRTPAPPAHRRARRPPSRGGAGARSAVSQRPARHRRRSHAK